MSYATDWPVFSTWSQVPPLPSRAAFVAEARGNFCGIRLYDFALPKNTLFDPAVLCATDETLRRSGMWAHNFRGHNTVVVQPAFSYSGFPSFDYWHDLAAFRRILLALRHQGFRLVLLCSQDQDDASYRFANRDIEDLADATRDLVSAVCAGWEFEPSCDPQSWLNWSEELKTLFPDTYRVTHWTPERVGPEALPDHWRNEPEFWQYVHAHDLIHALFYQTPHGAEILVGDTWQDRVVECVERIQYGQHGWGGQRLGDVWLFESIAYDFTRDPAVMEQRGVEVGAHARALGCAASLNA